MAQQPVNLPRLAIGCLGAGGGLLVVGVVLLAIEAGVTTRIGLDVGPWGANFVVLGAILGASGFWMSWPHMQRHAAFRLAGMLTVLGCVLLIIAPYIEPLLTRVVAVAALVSGVRGAVLHLGDLPQLRHDGAMTLGEKAAIFSLIANGAIVVYLIYKTRALGVDAGAGPGETAGALGATAAIVLAILFAESLVGRLLRRGEGIDTLEDERDAVIREEAARIAHGALVTLILILVAQLGIGGAMEPVFAPNEVLGLSAPLAIAHALLAALFLSQCARNIAEIWQYRRARI